MMKKFYLISGFLIPLSVSSLIASVGEYGAELIYKDKDVTKVIEASAKRAKGGSFFSTGGGKTLDSELKDMAEDHGMIRKTQDSKCAMKMGQNLGMVNGRGPQVVLQYILHNVTNAHRIIDESRKAGDYANGPRNRERINKAIEGVSDCIANGWKIFVANNQSMGSNTQVVIQEIHLGKTAGPHGG